MRLARFWRLPASGERFEALYVLAITTGLGVASFWDSAGAMRTWSGVCEWDAPWLERVVVTAWARPRPGGDGDRSNLRPGR